jgi:hypothetical protein
MPHAKVTPIDGALADVVAMNLRDGVWRDDPEEERRQRGRLRQLLLTVREGSASGQPELTESPDGEAGATPAP